MSFSQALPDMARACTSGGQCGATRCGAHAPAPRRASVAAHAMTNPRVNAATAAPPRTTDRASPADKPAEVPMADLYKDYALGYKSCTVANETEGWITEIEGAIPKELTGTLLRNGPALFEREGFKKEYLDGDGMVASVAFRDGKAYFRNKFVRTESFKREQEAGRFVDLSIFTAPDPRPAVTGKKAWHHRLLDDILMGPPSPKNNAAYNAWYWGGSLVAVDFSKPHGLDANTLDTIGPHSTFSSENYTAHSRIVAEPDGSLRLCAFSPEVDWSKQVTTIKFIEFNEAGEVMCRSEYKFGPAYFHDMIVTDNWYILFDCPIKMDYYKAFVGYPMESNSLGDTLLEDTDRDPVFRMFPRRRQGEMVEVTAKGEHCFAYHHVNGFDMDPEGKKVVFDTCTWNKFSLYFKDIIEPDGKTIFPRTVLSRFVLDTETGVATRHVLNERPCEYPTVAPAATGKPYRHAYMSCSGESVGDINGPMQILTKVSYEAAAGEARKSTESSWRPGRRKFVGEPLFVPRENGSGEEDDGWVVLLVHNSEDVDTELAILDAKDMEAGPVALMKLPAYVPMGVHGSWTDEYILGPASA